MDSTISPASWSICIVAVLMFMTLLIESDTVGPNLSLLHRQYYTMGLSEVQASEPYIHFSDNTGIAVQRGPPITLGTSLITITIHSLHETLKKSY